MTQNTDDSHDEATEPHINESGGWSTDGLAYLQKQMERQRVYVVHPYTTDTLKREGIRSPQARLNEALGLAAAIEVELVGGEAIGLRAIKPATYLGKGKLEELRTFVKANEIDLVVFDCELNPVQQRNLERDLKAKVIDRTALILEIFGNRASTKEGELQVELAHLNYQRSRLVRSWTHLERQRGGAGFMGGPGETQIEADRRIIADRITRIRRQLDAVTRTRTLHRARRQKAPYPIVALVGYTNAGKSTLFNRVTDANVLAEDMLFATLDPTMRAITLDSGRKIIMSDTVGFISELPTTLVAAFRATLEEVLEADVVVHVRDAAHDDTDIQKTDVEKVLKELGVSIGDIEAPSGDDTPIIEVMNKCDLLPDNERQHWEAISARRPNIATVSGMTGVGCDSFLEKLDEMLNLQNYILEVTVPFHDGQTSAWLHANSKILREDFTENGTFYKVSVDPVAWGKYGRGKGY